MSTVSTANFSLDLLKSEVSANPGKNVILPPLSVSLALGMTANGARGNTLAAMLSTLKLAGNLSECNAAYSSLLKALSRPGLGVTLDLANALFAKCGVDFNEGFRRVAGEFFDAGLHTLDFDLPEAVHTINDWVAQRTGQKILKLLGDDAIDSNTILFLISCVHFKGEWSVKFDRELTKPLPFQGVGEVSCMYRQGSMIYGKEYVNETYEYVSLPFGDSQSVRFIAVVPGVGRTVENALAVITPERLVQMGQNSAETVGELWLPRIDVSFSNSLNETLIALGMGDAFGRDADFSGMRKIPPAVFIKDVQTKTVFKLNEEGGEGDGAAEVEMGLECMCEPFSMTVDKPFVFFVVDSDTDAILFNGVITNPNSV